MKEKTFRKVDDTNFRINTASSEFSNAILIYSYLLRKDSIPQIWRMYFMCIDMYTYLSYILLFLVCVVCVCTHAPCYGLCVQVRGQLVDIAFLLLLSGSWRLTSGSQARHWAVLLGQGLYICNIALLPFLDLVFITLLYLASLHLNAHVYLCYWMQVWMCTHTDACVCFWIEARIQP